MSKRGAVGHRREGRGDMAKHDSPPKPNPSRRMLPSGSQGPLTSGGRHGYMRPTKREQAAERQAFVQTQTPAQRIAALDKRLGVGVGAKRERAKLAKLLQK